jgi:hypothetical protein
MDMYPLIIERMILSDVAPFPRSKIGAVDGDQAEATQPAIENPDDPIVRLGSVTYCVV